MAKLGGDCERRLRLRSKKDRELLRYDEYGRKVTSRRETGKKQRGRQSVGELRKLTDDTRFPSRCVCQRVCRRVTDRRKGRAHDCHRA